MFVSERMSKDLITVGPDVTIFEAKKLMVEKEIRHLPVTDVAGKLLGIVSDRDIRAAMPSTLLKKSDYDSTLAKIMNYPVRDIMTSNPLTIYAYYTIQDSLLVMQKKKVGALPVIDQDGYLKGLLSVRDLLRAFVNVLNIDEPGCLLCIIVKEKQGQMKRIVDIITEEKISLGSVLVARVWDKEKRAVFPYLLTNNVANVKKRLIENGFELLDPMKWYLEQLPSKAE
ncbi:MAG: CBS domain-containing protein [Desulforhopalus sp.]|nr:CBS domain-containing protein [Desulforhopalus sp.]